MNVRDCLATYLSSALSFHNHFLGEIAVHASRTQFRSCCSCPGTICPHLRTGDALLFDTRTLHFGLGNLKNGVASADASTGGSDGASSSNVNVCWRQTGPDRTRALLYINYWQPWWDKNTDKNWGQSELFNDEDRNAAVTEAQQRLLGISL